MHKAWSSIEEVPYCFSRSSVKFKGHTALKIVEFYSNWAFPDCNSSLNSLMATAKERCPIVFQGHPSNFKVTREKTSLILTQIGRFRTIGRSQLSNPSDLPCSIIHVQEKICNIASNKGWFFRLWEVWCRNKCSLNSVVTIFVIAFQRLRAFRDSPSIWCLCAFFSISCREHHRWEGSVGFCFWIPLARFRKPPQAIRSQSKFGWYLYHHQSQHTAGG